MARTNSVTKNVSSRSSKPHVGSMFDTFRDQMTECYSAGLEKSIMLFTTDIDGERLFDTYLENLPTRERQHHQCNCCRDFMRKYGGLVYINSEFKMVSALWNKEVVEPYIDSVNVLNSLVKHAKITGVFLSEETSWGYETKGHDKTTDLPFSHFHINPSSTHIYKPQDGKNAYQKMAARKEEYKMLNAAFDKYSTTTIRKALHLATSEALDRSEKITDRLNFLYELIQLRNSKKKTQASRDNIIWQAISTVPAGWCNVSGSIVGSLMDDIDAGLDVETIKRRFNKNIDSINYMRPNAAPSAGNIAMAEKLFEQMNLEPALHRRFARLEEIQTIWQPRKNKSLKRDGVFSHLEAKNKSSTTESFVPSYSSKNNITFDRFMKTVLPLALEMSVYISNSKMNFRGTLTSVYPDAKPILQWDNEEKRNPFSTYTYHEGSYPTHWGLSAYSHCRVNAVMLLPHMWYIDGGLPNHEKGAMFILDNAKDQVKGSGNAIFPEDLKSTLHSVRSTIETYSASATMHEKENGTANGINAVGVTVLVKTELGKTFYTIDRWI